MSDLILPGSNGIVDLNARQQAKTLKHNATVEDVINLVSQALNQALVANLGDQSPLIQVVQTILAKQKGLEERIAKLEPRPEPPVGL